MKQKIVDLYIKADKGCAISQNKLAYRFQLGSGVEKNLKKAVKWYIKSAQQGNANGQASLGMCYQFGQGVEKNLEEAVKLYRTSADQGNAKG